MAVYSSADREAGHVRSADQAVEIGPPPPRDSYLRADALIAAARSTGCDAIHPGYGFLAENAEFAARCAAEGLIFIGPSPDSIRLMGDKSRAREVAVEAGVPVVPGSASSFHAVREAAEAAPEVGFPILLKARAGGGGRGMRVVTEESAFGSAFGQASNEAQSAFGDGGLYLERFFPRIHHIEVQVFGDEAGTIVHLGERDCSVQRRHQKLIEESPSPIIAPETRAALCEAAVLLARRVGYRNAGTVEFIYDPESSEFYFIEMNTRIQVEHPVTEAVTGHDLVREQLRVAAGEPLSFGSAPVTPRGHAIEFRINAEAPLAGFRPSPGKVQRWRPPTGPEIRFDSHIVEGDTVPPFYDSLLGKLIVSGPDRDETLERAREALGAFEIGGIESTLSVHLWLLQHPDFLAGRVHTRWLEANLA